MEFANFFVTEGEITKQYKGCYKTKGPASGDRGTIGGAWQPSPVSGSIPVPHNTIEGLYIFPIQTSDWTKMVGMQYGGPQGPVRVDGRAYSPVVSLDANSISNAWDNAQDKNIGPSEYALTITNTTPTMSAQQCMDEANKAGVSVFSVTNMNQNSMAQCVTGSGVNTNSADEIADVNEADCLKMSNASTVYGISLDGISQALMNMFGLSPSSLTNPLMGKTYLGEKKRGTDKMTFYEYPDSMLSLGTKYNKVSGFDSYGSDLSSGSLDNSNVDSCKQICVNKGQECKGFVFDKENNICYMKNKIFPNTERQPKSNLDIYTRMPVVNNDPKKGCPDGVEAVSSSFLTNSGYLSKDAMSVEHTCQTEKQTIEELEGLEVSYKTLSEQVGNLREENSDLMKGFEEVRQRFKTQTEDYDDVTKKISKLKENPTTLKMLDDMQTLVSSTSMRNTGLILGFILLMIIFVRTLRK